MQVRRGFIPYLLFLLEIFRQTATLRTTRKQPLLSKLQSALQTPRPSVNRPCLKYFIFNTVLVRQLDHSLGPHCNYAFPYKLCFSGFLAVISPLLRLNLLFPALHANLPKGNARAPGEDCFFRAALPYGCASKQHWLRVPSLGRNSCTERDTFFPSCF